jgi:hypothetical protein
MFELERHHVISKIQIAYSADKRNDGTNATIVCQKRGVFMTQIKVRRLNSNG